MLQQTTVQVQQGAAILTQTIECHMVQSMADLHGVHRNVYSTFQERIINLLGKKSLATNVCQRLAKDFVTCSF